MPTRILPTSKPCSTSSTKRTFFHGRRTGKVDAVMPTGRNSRLLRPTDRSSDATEAYTSHRTHRRTLDSGSFRRSRMFFLRYHRLAKGSRTAYKFHLHTPYRPHGSKVENRYGIHRKASAHCVDRQNNHSPGHDCPPRKPPKGQMWATLSTGQDTSSTETASIPLSYTALQDADTADRQQTMPHLADIQAEFQSRKEEWTNFPNNMK